VTARSDFFATRSADRDHARQQKGITSNVTSAHGTASTSTATSIDRTTDGPSTRGIRVRDEEVAFITRCCRIKLFRSQGAA
jgi:hypothetical protein